MPNIQYKEINFRQSSLDLIKLVNQVIQEYQAQGYELTLRQAYYQLVARGYIPNNERSYKNIGNLINDGRLAGLIDWYAITDRTRNLRGNSHWDTPAEVIESAKYSYRLDKWEGQPNYVERYGLRRTHWWTLWGRLAALWTYRSSPAVATLPSPKCGLRRRDLSVGMTGSSVSSSTWVTTTRPALI